jgi:hypothetical protein
MEDRTQIKFSNPEIDGTPVPVTVTLEQENPIEGTVERNGQNEMYHKWLCKGNQYFMASHTLDAMLKATPNRVGVPVRIEKVVNPNGGYPFFCVNGLSKDDITSSPPSPSPPPPTTPVPAGITLESIMSELKEIKALLVKDENLPF